MNLSTKKVARYMERFTKIRQEISVAQALQMVDIDPNHLGVVVDADNALKGILGVSDIAQAPNIEGEMSKTLKDAGLFTRSAEVATCQPDDSLDTVLDMMDAKNVKSCVVVENNRPIGVITRRGLRQRLLGEFRIKL